MKILGITAGRPKGNCEVLIKTALNSAAAKCGAEIELVRLQTLNLKDCIGCESCMKSNLSGGDGKCVIKDDLQWLTDVVKDVDGIILAAPVYDLAPSGTVMTLVNRSLGVGREFQLACKAKPKIGAAISVGGSDFVNLTEPLMEETIYDLCKGAITVDRMVVGHNTSPAMVLCDDSVIERAKLLGERVADALLDRENAKFSGNPGVCPGCHCNILEYRGKDVIACAYCDAWGCVTVEDGVMKINWDEQSVLANRFTEAGQQKHRADISANHKKAADNKELIQNRLKEYDDFTGTILKPVRN